MDAPRADAGAPAGWRVYHRILAFLWGTVPFTILCISLNVIGLVTSQFLGSSFLFLDMFGTAFAALSKGIGFGVVVGLASNTLGQFLPSQGLGPFSPETYRWFAVANAAGALCWATLPRRKLLTPKLRRLIPTTDLFSANTFRGYRRLLWQIVVIGALTGLVVAVVGFLVQQTILGCGSNKDVCATASLTASTSTRLNGALEHFIGSEAMARLISLMLFNIPDKILATAAAVVLTLSWSPIPNYTRQTAHLRDVFDRYTRSPIRRFSVGIYQGFVVTFLSIYIYSLPWNSNYDTALISSIVIFSVLILVSCFQDRLPLYHVFYKADHSNDALFHDPLLMRGQSFQRDVFEDIFKTATVIAALLDGFILRGNGGVDIYQITRTIVLLTLVRYTVVFLMRMSGRFDQAPASRTLS